MSDFIVDASVAVKWLVAETDSMVADELSAGNHRLFAPRLILTEVANVLARKAIAGLMSVQPDRAMVIRDGHELQVASTDVRLTDAGSVRNARTWKPLWMDGIAG